MIRENVALAPYSYYKIGGPARYFAEPSSIEELKAVSKFIKENNIPYFVLGSGSNILFDDQGFDGLVLFTGKLNRKLEHNNGSLTCGTSVTVSQLLRYAGQNGLGGLEFLVGVPGNVGGTVFMNAGTKTGDISKIAEEITVFDMLHEKFVTYKKDQIKYSYRTQEFLNKNDLVYEARFNYRPSDPAEIQRSLQSLLAARKASQPIDKPSCGSVFKNPDPENGIFAWKLINDAGLRGRRAGNAQVSDMHTNFIINCGNATANDVKALIDEIKVTIQKRFGISMEEEVRVIPYTGNLFLK